MTKQEAEQKATWSNDYVAKKRRDGTWGVWCWSSDHWVEFNA